MTAALPALPGYRSTTRTSTCRAPRPGKEPRTCSRRSPGAGVAQRCSYEGRGRTVGKVDSVHVDGKYIERTLVEGTIGVVECAECPCHSAAIKVSHRFVEKGLSFCGLGARGQARTIHREHEDSCAGAAKHCSESHGRLLLGCKAEAKLEQSVARKLGLVPRTSGLNISTAVRKKAFSEPTTVPVETEAQ